MPASREDADRRAGATVKQQAWRRPPIIESITSRGSENEEPYSRESGGATAGRSRYRGLPRHYPHTVKVGCLYEPEETGISHLTGYGATAAVSLGAPGLVSVEGCGLFTYVHTVKEDRMTHQHNLPASYCLTVGL